MNGPPQEGLDPKLRNLTDLAPADENEETSIKFGEPDSIETGDPANCEAAADGPRGEAPPQFGQDPKLLACVNDGEEEAGRSADEAAVRADEVATAAAVEATANVQEDFRPPAPSLPPIVHHDPKNLHANAAPAAFAAPPPSPTKAATAAAAMISIQAKSEPVVVHTANPAMEPTPILVPPQTSEAKSPTPISVQAAAVTASRHRAPNANENPHLNSKESLEEWNRIHAEDAAPNYNFFKNKQQQQQQPPVATAGEGAPNASGRDPNEDYLVEASRQRAAAKNDAVSPLFTLNPDGSVVHGAVPPTVHTHDVTAATARLDERLQAAPGAAAPSGFEPPAPEANIRTNTNFWLQEEEERFLLGLRLYGWGQWKRIQTIVQTRTNKQIKSHAQKREKVNPDIKVKYCKGKSRRGRISSKVLAEDARAMAAAGGSVGEVANAILQNDNDTPSLDQAWKDVYGTNSGDGPNSRSRRFRHHSGFVVQQVRHPQNNNSGQLALMELKNGEGEEEKSNAKKEDPAVGAAIGASVVAGYPQKSAPAPMRRGEYPRRSLQESLANPLYKQPKYTRDATAAASEAKKAGMDPVPIRPTPLKGRAVEAVTVHQPPPPPEAEPTYASNVVPLPAVGAFEASPAREGVMPPPPELPPPTMPTVHAPTAPPGAAASPFATSAHESPSKQSDVNSLRPGMQVYCRSPTTDDKPSHWTPGTIYSAKVDPAKLSNEQSTSVPLIYHIQFDNGKEDPNVSEEDVMSPQFYEEAVGKLEEYHALPVPSNPSHPLESGTPVYCQWVAWEVPEMHGRWLPGTINSYRLMDDGNSGVDGNGPAYVYHVLLDDEREGRDVQQFRVLVRHEYQQLADAKYNGQGAPAWPADIYALFSRKGEGRANAAAAAAVGSDIGGNGEGGGEVRNMDLLSAASETHKRQAAPDAGGDDKRQKLYYA